MNHSKITLTLLFFFAFATGVFAQTVEVKAFPIRTLFLRPAVAAEVILNDNIGVEAKIARKKIGFSFMGVGLAETGVAANLGGRYYLNPNHGGDRAYVGSYLKYVDTKTNFPEVINNFERQKFVLGFNGGFKLVSKSGFLMDLNLGIGRSLMNNRTFNNEASQDFIDAAPSLKTDFTSSVGIGWRF